MNGKKLKKISTRLSGFFVISVFAAFLVLSAVAYAEEIIYTGDENKLQEAPSWFSDEKYYFGLFPGTTDAPLSIGNKVTIDYAPDVSGATMLDIVLGGLSESEKTEGNRVTLLNGQVEDIIGGSSYYGDAVGNSVIISGGSVEWLYGGWSDDGGAADNNVTISGGTVGSDVLGGFSNNDATGNMVTISGGSVDRYVFGGWSDAGGAANNNVTISGGAVKGNIYGGWSRDGDVWGNKIVISGGSVTESVYGGYCNQGNVTGNIITISGRPELTEAHLWGGQAEIEQEDTFTGNTLNFKSSGILAAGVGKFEYYNFYLPEELAAGAVMLSVADTVNLKGTTVAVFLQGGVKLKKGDKIALIHSAAGVSDAPKNKSCQVQQGGAFYEFSIYTDSNNLWAKVEKVGSSAK